MGKFSHNKVIRGTFGRVWVNGELMANVKSFEAKATIDYEDLDINGDFGQKKRYMGYSIAGTMTLHKFDSSRMVSMMLIFITQTPSRASHPRNLPHPVETLA